MAANGINWSPWRRPGRPPSTSSGFRRRRTWRGELGAAGRSLLSFWAGLTLASFYGATMIVLKGAPLWTCVYGTLAVAAVAAFGMGASARARGAVVIMMPALCSAHGRNFLLLVSASVLVSGPVANTLENAERAAASLLCGAELAANQTRQLMRNAATPLLAALDHIRQIGRNAAATATRINKLIGSLSDAVRHVARTLRNVLHFLVDIKDVCNDKLGSSYRKCRAVFVRARADCTAQLGDFDFLCDIVRDFMYLCELSKAPILFCAIPEYVSNQLRKHLAEPAISAFHRLRSQFEFDLSVSATLEADANVSRSLPESAQEILDQLTRDFRVFAELRGPLVWAGLVLLACSLIRAVRYQHRYLTCLNYDNVYISAQFIALDHQVTSEGGASILPITRRESQLYIRPLSLRLTSSECRAALVGVAWVSRHALMSAVLVALDFLVFWLLDQVHWQVQRGVVARAPVTVSIQVNGSGYMADMMRDLAASFNVLQTGNVTVISEKCLLTPSEPDYAAYFALGFLLGVALLVTLAGGAVQRSRRLICAYFHPDTERARIHFLRQLILDERRATGRALVRAAARRPAGGAEAGRGHLRALLRRLPGGGAYRSDICVACGEGARSAAFVCDVLRCPGVFCKACFSSAGRKCGVCARPATYQEDSQEEADSSEDELEDARAAAKEEEGPEPPSVASWLQSPFSSAISFLQDIGSGARTPR
ncbi:DC-STAMP domain-containing protein 2 isoform X1 [Phyllopteryx taeniolatus]|uniref:DC-STAMP domain-containing protein 2 isoform X1 n=1 Tax=Phyllopteryx taeniolatus TaxID=161469 RepID=UPI002AD3A1B2|nr:DC-STAMP domain-containing protein 2 isoform X1 [Phyllopteryx taeniolatus]